MSVHYIVIKQYNYMHEIQSFLQLPSMDGLSFFEVNDDEDGFNGLFMVKICIFILILNQQISMKFMVNSILIVFVFVTALLACDPCFNENLNKNCREDTVGKQSYTLHMSVHPHLDAFWIFNFESYYDPKPHESDVRGYFSSNRFNSVKEIFTATKNVLWQSKNLREQVSNKTQEAHRTFFNSEMGFFKRWFLEQSLQDKDKVRAILKTKYWQILGGGYVEHDEGCAYYDDIIQNFELGLHFLKQQFNYFPRVAVSADSFGHSQTSLAILAHLGVEGYFVQRSDQHILLKNKTQFIWRARSSNGRVYGALPTHIRWAIHGFQDQFIGGNVNENFCQTKEGYVANLRKENEFLKRILKSTHIMRYFGHDFQRFDDYSYKVIESIMKKFSYQKCNKVTAVYGNPTEYFITLMGQVFGRKVKPVVTRSEDIFPIWDYDSGLYWTGYFTTDAYHKKDYRNLGVILRGARKFYLPLYLSDAKSQKNKDYYQKLQEVAEQVSYLQHHDGISGTSKYTVMDSLQVKNVELTKFIRQKIFSDVFVDEFPQGTNKPIFHCFLNQNCIVPDNGDKDIYLKVLNSDGNTERDPIILDLPVDVEYQPDCEYQLNCFCFEDQCPCKLYLYAPLSTYTAIKLTKVSKGTLKRTKLSAFTPGSDFSFNNTHFKISYAGGEYAIGYKKVEAKGTSRQYDHLSRYGNQVGRGFYIRPGKYALGNDPNTAQDLTSIHSVSQLKTNKYTFFLIHWKRYQMKTLISIPRVRPNQWKVQTIAATEGYHLEDLYFEVASPIDNLNKFVTDSNGWLTVDRQMFKHEDYQAFFCKQKFDDLDGNSYPATAFVYLKDANDKVSINLQRPQGVTAYRKGTLWVNFDRLSEDDGKWVYQSNVRSQYQKYTHVVTVKNLDYNQRKIQRRNDQPLFIQGNEIDKSVKIEPAGADFEKRSQWNSASNIDSLKFSVRPFNDSTTILRLQNMHDEKEMKVGLYANKTSPVLTTYYGRTVTFGSITEQSLGGNMEYSQFINSKWNWKNVTDLSEENKIFNKVFRENITLAPLEIRTFLLKDLKIGEKCIQVSELTYTKLETAFQLNTNKAAPTRDPLTIELEKNIVKFMLEGNHCDDESPVLSRDQVTAEGTAFSGKEETDFVSKPIKEDVVIDGPKPLPPKPKVIPEKKVVPAEKAPVNAPEKTAPVPEKAGKDIEINYNTLVQKVNQFQPLSRTQKQIYFLKKVEKVRKSKLANK